MQDRRVVSLAIGFIIVSSLVIGALVVISSEGSAGPKAGSTIVVIRNFAYIPQNLTVKAGTTVAWENNDTVAHTVTSDPGAPSAFDSGVLNPGGVFSITFTTVGTYSYHCNIHPFMHGNITVTSSGPATVFVEIKNFAFTPQNVAVSAGTVVVWTNNDSVAHTVTTSSGATVSFDSGVLNPGASFSYTFTQAGNYPYYCKIHPFMLGNVTVSA